MGRTLDSFAVTFSIGGYNLTKPIYEPSEWLDAPMFTDVL